MIFSQGLKNEFETAVVNEPTVFEPLKFYCTCRIIIKILVCHDLSILCHSYLRVIRIKRFVALLYLWRNKVVIFGGKRKAEKIKLFCCFMPELNIF